jgi:hypothetical protein
LFLDVLLVHRNRGGGGRRGGGGVGNTCIRVRLSLGLLFGHFPPGRTIWRPQLVLARGCSISLSVLSPEGEAGRCCRYGVAVDVERAATLYAQGRSLRQIAAERGVHWSMEHQGRMLPRLGLEEIDGHIAYEIAVL